MKTTNTQLVSTPEHPMTSATVAHYARTTIAHYGEQILAEIPTTLRRLRTLFLVLCISIPAFFAGLLVVLWHLAR